MFDVDQAMEDRCTKTQKQSLTKQLKFTSRLGVDGRHADQQVRGAIVLPHGTGKTKKVLVFAKGPKATEAEEAGADFVGAEEMAQKIQSENWFDFDVVVATPDMMGVVGRLGKILGPKGLNAKPEVRHSYYGCCKGYCKKSRLVKLNTVWTRQTSSIHR